MNSDRGAARHAKDIFNRYATALADLGADTQKLSGDAVALALRLATQDAYDAGAEMMCVGDDLSAIVASQEKALQNALNQIDPLRHERNALQQQLAQMDVDNAKLTKQLNGMANLTHLLQERDQTILGLQAEIDRLTRQNVIAVDAFNSLREPKPATNGNGAEAPADVSTWQEYLDAETYDWIISIEAGRRAWRQIPKPARLLIFQALARQLGNGAMPTQAMYEEHKPQWMPTATAIASGFASAWGELLTVSAFEVAP